MKKLLGMGLVSLALMAGCETKPKPVTQIPAPVTPAQDPWASQPMTQTVPPGGTDMGGGPFIPDTTPHGRTTTTPHGTTPTKPNTTATTAHPATPATPAAAAKVYVVKKGDTLSAIAKKYYGNANQFTKIVKANPGMNPNVIKPGQKINIP